jgi:predicted O-linked N-acetylglucosamine transferase (SPINDLY family)
MGIIFEKMGRYASSADYFQSALNAHPPADTAMVLASTASVSAALLLLGEADEAVEVLEGGLLKAAAASNAMGMPVQSPFDAVDPTFVQSYLFALNMSSKPRDEVSNAHLSFGKLVRKVVGPLVRCAVKDKDPSRRLKVGYLSGDLCKHVVADCLEGVLRARDREMQHVTCYQRNFDDDAQTEMLRSLSDDWVKCADLSPSQVGICL